MKLTIQFAILIITVCSVHPLFSQVEQETPLNFFEIDIALLGPPTFRYEYDQIDESAILDTVNHTITKAYSPELRIKYMKSLGSNSFLYGGIYLGTQVLHPAQLFADEQYAPFRPTSLPISPDANIPNIEQQSLNPIYLKYASIPLGLRFVGHLFKNDQINFSFGAKANFYPKQKLDHTEVFYSALREEAITTTTQSNLNTKANLTAGIETNISYQFISKNENFNLLFGIVIQKNETEAYTLDVDVKSESQSTAYDYSFQSPAVGLYLGTTYTIGK